MRTRPTLDKFDLCIYVNEIQHRSAKAQADLTVIERELDASRTGAGAGRTARGLAKSYGERLRGCNVSNMNPEKAQSLSPEPETGKNLV
jgi:transposase